MQGVRISATHTIIWLNDPEGFQMPYETYSPIDEQIMEDKYRKLRKLSKGLHIRLGSRPNG